MIDLNPRQQLSELFGSYKAEWLKEKLYDFYTEPAYFPELTTSRPCMLVGGRGTGKTTVLRCLSYEGQYALSGRNPESISKWSYYGMYYRVNTNRVTAFTGPELGETDWIRLFAHYLNLLMCDLILNFLEWYQIVRPGTVNLDDDSLFKIAKSLNLSSVSSIRNLANHIDMLRIEFEAYINNVVDANRPLLSVQGAPIDTLIEAISHLSEFKNKHFFFLLDEYENFLDYQQRVTNTLIKHSGQNYSFKIGVRELGWRQRTTLNITEQLISPADYVRINVAEKLSDEEFKKFALAVCNTRISKVQIEDNKVIKDISKALQHLSEDQEAVKLGVKEHVKSLRKELEPFISSEQQSIFDKIPLLEAYFVKFWASGQHQSIEEVFNNFLTNREEWHTRYQNYKHALLYTLKRRKRGIRKYYAGWDVFIKLSSNNIRYLLELVDQSLLLHLRKDGSLSQPVPPETQTHAAQDVAKKNLSELEGLSVHGARLTKLLLGLGRIFQVMAEDAAGHAPELNQFHLDDQEILANSQEKALQDLLTSSIMHLALVRFSGSKLAEETDTRGYDYMVHPIFTPFFIFSYRKKRKMKLFGHQLLDLINRPKEAIRNILIQNKRTSEEKLPDQLVLFKEFYEDHS